MTRASFEAKSKIPPHMNQTLFDVLDAIFCFIIHNILLQCVYDGILIEKLLKVKDTPLVTQKLTFKARQNPGDFHPARNVNF